MKLYTVTDGTRTAVCRETAPGCLALLPYESMNALLTDDPARRSQILSAEPTESWDLAAVRVLAPIPQPRQDILCLGMNYQKHKAEAEHFDASAFTRENRAVYFTKRANRCPGPGDPIPGHWDIVDSLDYETELAVVLGRDACRVSPEDAWNCVFGYTILNDVSARNLQTGHKQWTFGKGLDGFAPMGPCLVTADEFAQPPAQAIRTYVNGELRQDAVTDQLLFSIPYVISELSQGMTLLAGTILATGTPAGVGMGFAPPKFLRPGDTVRCEIEGIGVLENPVE